MLSNSGPKAARQTCRCGNSAGRANGNGTGCAEGIGEGSLCATDPRAGLLAEGSPGTSVKQAAAARRLAQRGLALAPPRGSPTTLLEEAVRATPAGTRLVGGAAPVRTY